MMLNNKSEWFNSQQRSLASELAAMQREALGKKTEAGTDGKKEKVDHKPKENKRLNEGKQLFHMKHWEDALKEFQKIDEDNADTSVQAELAYYLGLCYTKLDHFNEAGYYLEKVVASGNNPLRTYQCRMTLALIYLKTNRAKMAEFELKRIKSSGFASAPMYNAMAYAAFLQKRYRQAIDYYEKTLEIDRNNATAINSMGYILADRGFDNIRGLMLCRKAVEIRPKSAAYMDSLGWAYYKCGEMTEARDWLKKAIDSAPKENEIREHFRIVMGG
jgi:tetratricopeptide (TPR) repeat protein